MCPGLRHLSSGIQRTWLVGLSGQQGEYKQGDKGEGWGDSGEGELPDPDQLQDIQWVLGGHPDRPRDPLVARHHSIQPPGHQGQHHLVHQLHSFGGLHTTPPGSIPTGHPEGGGCRGECPEDGGAGGVVPGREWTEGVDAGDRPDPDASVGAQVQGGPVNI